ncbi:alpha carbonic anhydrase 4-like, partial [Phalaenopsis equestris]|uniref:alpha carbonic anhydrase 4-like n=1 Tax=Phalaenopsis equestris TaxID=78828 RepID=UPI0009E3C524
MKSIMEPFRQLILIISIVDFLYIKHCAMAYEHEEFSYKIGAWNGPDHWGDIRKDWETCKTGHSQSPVAIDDKKIELVNQPEDLRLSYHPGKAVMMNLGHNIVVTKKTLLFDLEVHLLHQQTTGQKMAMISNLFKVDDPDPFLTKNIGAKVEIGIIDPKKVSRMTKKYYRLMGYTTIPPCTEDVTWTINKKIRTLSPKQLDLLKEATIV